MKKLTVLLLAVLTLTSCTAGTGDIAEGLETYREKYEEPEVPYIPQDVESAFNIVSQDVCIRDGKYYFELKKAFDHGGGVRMITCVDVATGNFGAVCPDPLCTHSNREECKYADLSQCHFSDIPGVYYTYLFDLNSQIYRVDLNRDTVELVYTFTEEGHGFGSIRGYADGKLYFYQMLYETADKKTETREKLYYLEEATGEIVQYEQTDDLSVFTGRTPHFILDGYFWFVSGNQLIRTDSDYRNHTVVAEFDNTVRQWYMDLETRELYFAFRDDEARTGSVYVYRDGVTEQIPLPHAAISAFTLTEDRILYCIYDPVFYGISKLAFHADMNGETYDPEQYYTYDMTGGKLYAVDRDNPSGDAELIYASENIAADKLAKLDSCIALGDYLYFDQIEITREVINGKEYIFKSSARNVEKIRYGLKDGSLSRVTFGN
ncbi:MAG: hypothetical protein IJF78_02465 [Clostridia bacterium]|nr:hypothetical protein [Clostridia bacterium]